MDSLKGFQATLNLKIHTDVTPKFLKPRSVLNALKLAIKKDLERLKMLESL